jgi:hypothetical protein
MTPTPTPQRPDAREQMQHFVDAKRFDREVYADDSAFVDWMLSRCRYILALPAAPAVAGEHRGSCQFPNGGLCTCHYAHNAPTVAPASAGGDPDTIEDVAKAIYDLFPYEEQGIKPAWVLYGNSLEQDEARRYARAALAALAAPSDAQPARAVTDEWREAMFDLIDRLGGGPLFTRGRRI